MLGLVRDIFIETGGETQVAQVPVKRGLIFSRGFGDAGHHDVAAIAGVARDQEAPGCVGRFLRVREAAAQVPDQPRLRL